MEKRWKILAVVGIVIALTGALYFQGFFGNYSGTTSLEGNFALVQISNGSGTIPAYYFYGDGCTHCANIKPHLIALAAKYPNLELKQLEVYHNATNQEILSRVQQTYNLTTLGVPTLVIGDRALVGENEIRDYTELIIIEQSKTAGPGTNSTPLFTSVSGSGGCPVTGPALTLPVVVACALIDSVNPCAFAVLVFLLLSIITLESRRRVLAVGGAYIAAVFLFYLLSGIGLFTIVQQSGFSSVLFIGAATLAIILGLVNVIDVLRKNEGFVLAIPESRKATIERYINNASLPAAFVLGVLVGIFELPCTGGIYLAILGMMSKTLTFSEGLPYLILYNLIFVLPLVAILLIVTFGLSPEKVHSWRLENRRLLRLVIGLSMIVIGVVMLSGWM
jgi:cytochrome c biogenesis protein CcdA/thiol-disulfide isomerase/thioredoxin